MSAKNIVYLLGSGATTAELDRLGRANNLTMCNISEQIFDTLPKGKALKKYFPGDSINLNIEHIISLLESLELREYSKRAEKLRALFQYVIVKDVKDEENYIEPALTISLLEYHKTNEKYEKLSGIITVNYDSLLDLAFDRVYGKVNYGFPCHSKRYTTEDVASIPLLLKLHGSFNWKSGSPITIDDSPNFLKKCSSLWIPPSTFKKFENFPFNLIWGEAFKLLSQCDILRVIGCSLNQNDWGLLSLLFKTQLRKKSPYSIEIIDRPLKGIEVRERCAFLKRVISIEEIELDLFDKANEFNSNGKYTGPEFNSFSKWLKALVKEFIASNKPNLDIKQLENIQGKLNEV